MFAFRYLTLAIAVSDRCHHPGVSLLQLRQQPEMGDDSEAGDDSDALAKPAVEQLNEAVQSAARQLNRALTVNTTKGKVAAAYIALDTIFQDYLIEHYPLCGRVFTKERGIFSEYFDNDLLGNSLAPMEHAHEH